MDVTVPWHVVLGQMDPTFRVKTLGNPCSPQSSCPVQKVGFEAGCARWISSPESTLPVPGPRRTPIEIQGGIKGLGFALRQPWGSPAVGDLTPANSQSWQSKAAWPPGASVYFLLPNL